MSIVLDLDKFKSIQKTLEFGQVFDIEMRYPIFPLFLQILVCGSSP